MATADRHRLTLRGVREHLREQHQAEPKRDYDKAWLQALVDSLLADYRAADEAAAAAADADADADDASSNALVTTTSSQPATAEADTAALVVAKPRSRGNPHRVPGTKMRRFTAEKDEIIRAEARRPSLKRHSTDLSKDQAGAPIEGYTCSQPNLAGGCVHEASAGDPRRA